MFKYVFLTRSEGLRNVVIDVKATLNKNKDFKFAHYFQIVSATLTDNIKMPDQDFSR